MKIAIEKINRKLEARFGGAVRAALEPECRSIVVSGQLKTWADTVEACTLAAQKKGGWHVVNRVVCAEALAAEAAYPERLPLVRDESLEGARPDVLVIGGGISGAAVLRELARYRLDLLLVEKEADVAVQTSSRNLGEVHPGVDLGHRCLKQKYVVRGNELYPQVTEELGVPFDQCGQYVALESAWLWLPLWLMVLQRRFLGVKGTKVLTKKALYKAQPNLRPGYRLALFSPTAGSVSPYGLTIAYAENAVQNGAKVSLNTAVTGMKLENGHITAVETNRGTVYPRLVINAAGCFSDRIAEMAGDGFFSLHPRRGTEALLDRRLGDLTNAIVSYKRLKNTEKNTKGGGVLRTVSGNILVGPDAVETPLREDFSSSAESVRKLFEKHKNTFPALSEKDCITYFTGVRAASFEEDFILERGRRTDNIIHCAAIQSPGITAAPAFSKDIAALAVEMLGGAAENTGFNPVRRPIPRLAEMDEQTRAALIAQNPDYGVIVCRCEEISKGEILDALSGPLCVPTLDGVKRRVRAGMGRCQGGFCSPQVMQILAEYTGRPLSEITKKGRDSRVVLGGTKEASREEL